MKKYYLNKSILAERERFELSVPQAGQRFSRPPHSTTLAPLQKKSNYTFTSLIIFKLSLITITTNKEPKMFASKSNLLKVRLGINN